MIPFYCYIPKCTHKNNAMNLIQLYKGDCLNVMKNIEANSVDIICADLPFGTTRNKWDVIIPFAPLWKEYKRVCKKNAAIVLFGWGMFSAETKVSNKSMYKYTIVWKKTQPTNFLNSKRMPLYAHEDMNVFYAKPPTYNPQKTKGHSRKVSSAKHKRNSKKTTNYGKHNLSSYDSTERYPTTVWEFPKDTQHSAIAPTQKPVALIENLINTYTNEGETVLDNVSGSGTTGVAAINTNRNAILIEKDNNQNVFQKSVIRIEQHIDEIGDKNNAFEIFYK